MSAKQFTFLLDNPQEISALHNSFLEKTIASFPYFQTARALQLKNLCNQDSFSYNQELRKTAAYTTDRSVLFEFITADDFVAKERVAVLEINPDRNQIGDESDVVSSGLEVIVEKLNSKLEQSIIDSITESSQDAEPEPVKIKTIEESLELGKPINFAQNEKHSFQEWLQMAHFSPIKRVETSKIEPETAIFDHDLKKRKQEIIDKFIETNPKITPIKNYNPPVIIDKTPEDYSYIMTETLAKVYLEQKKYQKAIQAYEILILKYPEKFSFFADRITDIKKLQQNNN